MTQKLVRKVCPHCIEDKAIEEAEMHFMLKYLEPAQIPMSLVRGKGCMHCHHSGYLGRIPVFEGWSSNKVIQDLIASNANTSLMRENLEKHENFHNLIYNAIKLVTLGQTTLEEAKRVLGLL